jgi:nucleotidyltransferase substrate binding protein (TIGR01987 family)
MKKLEELIKNLKKANERLREATEAEPTRMNKDATIQRFEFTFELAWKTMQECLKSHGIDCKSPRNSIREAGRLDLVEGVEGVEKWFDFLDNRNLISHSYNEELADKIYKKALEFSKEVDILIGKIDVEKEAE